MREPLTPTRSRVLHTQRVLIGLHEHMLACGDDNTALFEPVIDLLGVVHQLYIRTGVYDDTLWTIEDLLEVGEQARDILEDMETAGTVSEAGQKLLHEVNVKDAQLRAVWQQEADDRSALFTRLREEREANDD